jgi:hypothetical protein
VATLAEWLEGEDDLIRDRITQLIHRRKSWALESLTFKVTVSGSVPVSGDFILPSQMRGGQTLEDMDLIV